MKNEKYEVRGVKGFMGMDCPGYNASLYRDGVKVAMIVDDGSGGETEFRWEDHGETSVPVQWPDWEGKVQTMRCSPEEAILREFLRGKTWKDLDEELGGKEKQMDPDMFVSSLVDDFENDKRFRRICKGKTLFRVKGDPQGEYRTIKGPFSLKIKDFLADKYGDQIEGILNEKFGQVAV